jgi:putative transposase
VLLVTTSGFYAWRKRRYSEHWRLEERDRNLVRHTYNNHGGKYGAPRVAEELRALGHRINEKKVARLMREMGLKGLQKPAFRPKTTVRDPSGQLAPDLIKRDFQATQPDQKWVGDITYLRTTAGWIYLATVIDCYSRRIVGWSLSSNIDTNLVTAAIAMALRRRPGSRGVIFHSDRGCQYTSHAFRSFLRAAGVQQSMGAVGSCYDNAVAESFFSTLKREGIDASAPLSSQATMCQVFAYIEGYYNPIRRHSHLGYLSPNDFERQFSVARQSA